MEEPVSEDVKLLMPLIEVMKIVRLTSLLPDMPRLSSPRPRLRHGCQLAHLSPISKPKSVYSLLRFATGSSSSSPNFLNCFSPKDLASVFADYLRSHFSFFHPKAQCNRVRGYLSEPQALRSLIHKSFCSPFYPAKFLADATNLSRSLLLAPTKLPVPC